MRALGLRAAQGGRFGRERVEGKRQRERKPGEQREPSWRGALRKLRLWQEERGGKVREGAGKRGKEDTGKKNRRRESVGGRENRRGKWLRHQYSLKLGRGVE